jgi:acetyl esterase/lipase
MTPPPAPHPLTALQRLQLTLARLLILIFAGFARLRRGGLPGPVEIRRYGGRRDERLEILHPPAGVPARTPIVYIHGGGWIFGKKELYSRDLGFLAERGHRVFNLDYPLAPENPFPVPLASLLEALAWIRSNEPDCEAVHLMGDSAGGNLVMMLGLLSCRPGDRARLCPELPQGALPEVLGIVSLYGVLDRLTWIEDGFPGSTLMLHCYGGRAAFEPEVGPEAALTPLDLGFQDHPPCLLAVGTADPLARSSRIAYEQMKKGPGSVQLEVYEGEQHGFFNMSWRRAAKTVRADLLDFLDGLPGSGAETSGGAATHSAAEDAPSMAGPDRANDVG